MEKKNKIDYTIKSTWHNMSKMYNAVAAKYDTTQATGMILLNIDKEGTPSTSIGPMLGVEATSLSRIMNTLESNELIYRKKDKKDKRMVRIFLTEKGVEKRKIAKKVVDGFHELIEAELSESKLDMFNEVMESVNVVIDKYKEKNNIK